MKKEITSLAEVKELVNQFYQKVNSDSLLAPIFNDVAHVNWEIHLPKMYAFWSSILLGSANYHGRPFPPHMELPIDKNHFERWMQLFTETVDENFEGELADQAKLRAQNIAAVFQYKLGILSADKEQA